MKLYPNLIKSVAETLVQVFVNQQIVEQATDKLFKQNPKWGSRDRRWVQDKIYNICRFVRAYAYALGANWNEINHQKESFFSQLVAVSELLTNAENREEIVKNWPDLDLDLIANNYQTLENTPELRPVLQSIPEWLDGLFCAQMSEELWAKNLAALNSPASVCVRINTDLTNQKNVLAVLDKKEIGYEILSETALLIKGKQQLTQLDIFQKGHFEIQDFNSQQLALQLDVQPHQTVIDTCAGAGGKTLQIANLLQKSGRIIALDIEVLKLAELQKRAQRAQAKNVQTVHIDAYFNPEKYHNTAQRVLIDAPCSGTGVWRRHADAKYKLSPETLQKLTETQASILQQYSHFCQVKGLIVYATCSVLPQENQLQIANFLQSEQGQGFELQSERTFYPADSQFDGFYCAVLKRNR